MAPLYRRSVLALGFAACCGLPLQIAASCSGGGGSPATTLGAGGTGGAGGGTSGTFSFDAGGGLLPDGCSGPDASDGGDGSTGCEGLEGGVTYAQVKPIFANCSGEICHGSWTHDNAVGVVATECCDGRFLVQPGNAAQSYILDKIGNHDTCQGTQMPPPPLSQLSDADVLTLRRWICEGAPGN
jgi:hypothetical protein